MPDVSVIIPCYNHGTFLMEALEAVHAQTFDNYEVVIVDDGSEDAETCALIEAIDHPKVRIIRTGNRGVAAARNRAISEARGTYLLPLDADDLIAPTYLEKAMALMRQHGDEMVVYCDQKMFGERDEVVRLPDYDPRRILVQNLLPVSALFPKSCWEKVGGFCESMTSGWEDWEFWVALTGQGCRVAKLDEALFSYRIRASSRDSRMSLFDKLHMFSLMVWRHRLHYLGNAGFVLAFLGRHLLSGQRRERTR